MQLKKNYEIVEIADEFVVVPVGEEATSFHGVIAINEEAAFLLKEMNKSVSKEDLIRLLVEEYDVDNDTAEKDVKGFLEKLKALNIVEK